MLRPLPDMAEARSTLAEDRSVSPAGGEPWAFERAVKDHAVEEAIDLHWHRRLAFALFVKPLENVDPRVRPTPTQITIASLGVGALAGGAYWQAGEHGVHWYAIGTALLVLSIALDCADGMLARLTKTTSEFGLILDGFVDFVVGVAIVVGLGHSALLALPEWWALPSVVVLFLSIMAHVAYYDHVKNIFARLCVPKSERPPAKRPHGTGVFAVSAAFMYNTFYGGASRVICGPDIEHLDHVEHDVARRELMPMMRNASWLGVGLHFFVMYTAALAAIFVPHATFIIAHAVLTVGLSAWMIVTVVTQRRAARRLRFG